MCGWDNQVQQARGCLLQAEITCSETGSKEAVKAFSTPCRHVSETPETYQRKKKRGCVTCGEKRTGVWLLNSSSSGVMCVDSSLRRLAWLSIAWLTQRVGLTEVLFSLRVENLISTQKRSWEMFQLHRKCINAHNWITYQFLGHCDWSDTICQWYLVSQIGSEWEMLNVWAWLTGNDITISLAFSCQDSFI